MTDREKALEAINRWDMELGWASQYYIENGDKDEYDECQENHAIYETIKAALSQEPIDLGVLDDLMYSTPDDDYQLGITDGINRAKELLAASYPHLFKGV